MMRPSKTEQTCKPNFVSVHRTDGNHSSRLFVTEQLERPTRNRLTAFAWSYERATHIRDPLFGLAPRGVYLAAPVTKRAGELLPHRFTLDLFFKAGLFSVALVVTRFHGARTLSGSLPYGVRTFLFDLTKRLPGLLHCKAWLS